MSVSTELELLTRASHVPLVRAIEGVIRVEVDRGGGERETRELARLFEQTLTLSDLLGRAELLDELDGNFAAKPSLLVRAISFVKAIADLVRREPRLAKTAERVSKLYRTEHAFALAKSTALEVTQRVRDRVADAVSRGEKPESARAAVKDLGPWSKAYAETVYTTNVSAAYTAGRMDEARSSGVMRAFEYVGPADADARSGRKMDRGENHVAAIGLIASVDDPIWTTHSPPSGYSCRHRLRLVLQPELERLGLIVGGVIQRREPSSLGNFAPHPNFASSPLQRFYGNG